MRVLLLSDGQSAHTVSWVRQLSERGLELALFSLRRPADAIQGCIAPGLARHAAMAGSLRLGGASKLRYVRSLPVVRRLVRDFQPDIVHAHYATSYGLLGALSGFRPLVISVWGSDVYLFPRRSVAHRLMLSLVLRRADVVLSTSRAMAAETRRYTMRPTHVTPFGVDTDLFRPDQDDQTRGERAVMVGTVKSLEPPYGIEYLIQAFALLVERRQSRDVRLRIVGGGSRRAALESLARELGVAELTEFVGRVAHAATPELFRSMDLFACLSISESFGVSVLEASACGIPVVATDVGGLPEVVVDGETGFLVPPRDPEAAAEAMERLIADPELRRRMGQRGQSLAGSGYSWPTCTERMMRVYDDLVQHRPLAGRTMPPHGRG